MGNGEFKARCPDCGNFDNENKNVDDRTIKVSELNPKGLEQDIIAWKLAAVSKTETVAERLERYIDTFTLSQDTLKAMHAEFVHELQLGLELHKSSDGKAIDPKMCSFKMLDSFVKDIPTGSECGICYAIDFGGTNLRSVRLQLKGDGSMEISQHKENLYTGGSTSYPKGLMDKDATATELFDFIATSVKDFMKQSGDLDTPTPYSVGFTFSFPCSMRDIKSATLVEWTKDFETGTATDDAVEGRDVCDLLQIAFERNGVPAKVAAVMNDTVGTLLSCAYEMDQASLPKCRIGVILGTGMNACYFDENCKTYNYIGNIINIECGNFNRSLPLSNVDYEIDFESPNRGAQLLEKMVSGAYLGEICRRAVLKVLQNSSPPKAWFSHTLTTEDACKIALDKSDKLSTTSSIVKASWECVVDELSCSVIQKLCAAVFDRSAALAAVFISACATKTGYLQAAMGGVTVGIDGSMYKCNPKYQKKLKENVALIVGDDRAKLIHMVLADDGSGKGAGVVAAQLVGA